MMTYLYKIGSELYMSDHSEEDLRKAYAAALIRHPLAMVLPDEWDVALVIEGGKEVFRSNQIIVKPEIRTINFAKGDDSERP